MTPAEADLAPGTAGRPPRRSLGWWPAAGALLASVAWSWSALEIEPGRLFAGLPRMGEFFGRMVPPDWSVARTVLRSTGETLQVALLGTVLAVVASLPLGLLAAANLTPRALHQPVKWLLAGLRAIPLILLALFFVSTVGLGAFPGILAIAVHSTGMLGKFYAEAMEAAGSGPVLALDSVGATWFQRVRFAVLPQVAPDLVRDTLFRFELNFRESIVLGLVGAGGIGFYIQLYIRAFQYEKVATLTLVVLVLVVVVEQVSSMVRRRLR
jgi:phosphonate transport system permease protein